MAADWSLTQPARNHITLGHS